MFKKLGLSIGLSVILLGSFSVQTTVHAVNDDLKSNEEILELIEKAEKLSQTSDEEVFIIDDYEIALGEEITDTENSSDNVIQPFSTTFKLSGKVNVSRPIVPGVGVMTATATSTTSLTAYSVNVRANVNNNGDSMSNGTWKQLRNTTFASASTKGKTRTGIGHGNHTARRISSSSLLSVNTTNRNYQK